MTELFQRARVLSHLGSSFRISRAWLSVLELVHSALTCSLYRRHRRRRYCCLKAFRSSGTERNYEWMNVHSGLQTPAYLWTWNDNSEDITENVIVCFLIVFLSLLRVFTAVVGLLCCHLSVHVWRAFMRLFYCDAAYETFVLLIFRSCWRSKQLTTQFRLHLYFVLAMLFHVLSSTSVLNEGSFFPSDFLHLHG